MAEVQLKSQLARIETMTNVELRAELKRRGCSTTGNKKDLLAKLRVALQNDCQQQSLSNNEKFIVQNSSDSENVRLSTNSSISEQDSSSLDNSQTNENLSLEKPTSDDQLQTINTEQVHLDTSTNNNNNEVISFVSKSNEENEIDREKLGEREELHSLSVGSSYAKSESIVKEIPLSDKQQRLNSSKSELQNEQNNSATNFTNDDSKNKNIESSADSKSDVTAQQENLNDEDKSISVDKESDKPVPQQQLKITRSQTSSSIKILNRSTSNRINLNLEILKTIVPDLSLLPESAINAEFEALLNDQNIEQTSNEPMLETNVDNNAFLSDSMTIGELADQKQQNNRTVVMNTPSEDSSLNDDSLTRKKPTTNRISSFESKTFRDGKSSTIVTDEPIRIKNVTETNQPLSKILYINGLTRPFSLLQLKGLLSRYGKLVDGEFWLDKIKSQCFVTYETLEEAQNAREALDGCRWPSTNPKTLSVRFSQRDEFEFSKSHDSAPDQMSKPANDRVAHENVTTSRRSPSPIVGTKSNMREIRSDPNESEKRKHQDENKQIQNESFDNDENEPVKSNETSAKGLDDYFHKTKAKPSIYWLPLTEEQIVERNLRQQQRNAERDEEQKKREFTEKSRQTDARSKRRTSSPREKRKHNSTSPKRDSKRH